MHPKSNEQGQIPEDKELKLLDLASDESQAKLKAALEASGGIAVVLVHPYYSVGLGERKPEYATFYRSLKHKLRRAADSRIPIIQMVPDNSNIALFKIAGINSETEMYFVRTKPSSADIPLYNESKFYDGDRVRSFTQMLKELGLNKIILAGELLMEVNDEHFPQGIGCTYGAYLMFHKVRIKVDYSTMTYPVKLPRKRRRPNRPKKNFKIPRREQ